MLLVNSNGTFNSLHLNQTNYQPYIISGWENRNFNNLTDHYYIEKLSQLIKINDEVNLLENVNLPIQNRKQLTQYQTRKRINRKQIRHNNEASASNRLKFSNNRLDKLDNSLKCDSSSSESYRSSNLESKLNNRVYRDSQGKLSRKLNIKINRKEFDYDLDGDKFSQRINGPIYRLNNLDDNLGLNNRLENRKRSKNSSNHHENTTYSAKELSPFLTSFTSALLKSEFLSSIQKPFQTTTFRPLEQPATNYSILPHASPLTKQPNHTFDLFKSSTAKLSIKSILNNSNETLFARHTMPITNSTFNVTPSNIAYEYPSYIRNSATIIFAIIFLFGTIGNILVSLIIFRSKELRNTTNYFLINLSIADLLVIIVCMPTVLIELHQSKPEIWLLGEFMCKTIPYVEMSVAHASILTMLAISFERFYAICKPLKVSYKCTKLRAVLIILGIWVIALLATLPLLFIAKQSSATYLDGSLVQVCLTQANDLYSKSFFLIIIALFFFFPLIILVIIYVAITKKLCTKENISYAESVQMRARRQVVIMLATVIICFFICLLPFRLFTLFLLFISAERLDGIGMETYYVYLYTSRVMLYLNSALNPLLYNLISSKFRNAFVHTLLCCCRSPLSTNRMLIRQSTFNTTTTTMSLSGLNVSLNNNFISNSESNSGDLNGSTNKHKRNTIQTGSLKQSRSIDTNLKQLNYKRNRQASLQQFNSTSAGLLTTKDENDNKIDNYNKKIDNCDNKKIEKFIKQTSFIEHEVVGSASRYRLDDVVENGQSNSKSNTPDILTEASKKQCTVNCELKVSTLQEDIISDEDTNSVIRMNLDGRLGQKGKFDFKFYNRIKGRLFGRVNENNQKTNQAKSSTSLTKTVTKQSIIEEDNGRKVRDKPSKESNV